MIKFIFKALALAFIICSSVVFAGYLIYCSAILIWSPPNTLDNHDAIIVLTGSKGRIETGFELLIDNHAPKMLISGVLNQVSRDELIQNNAENLTLDQLKIIQNHCCIALDYTADTTETNAIESAQWITDNDIKSIILVTSASHMPRAYLLFHRILDDTIKITTYPYQTQRRFDLVMSQEFWHYAAREYIKFGGNLIRLERQ